MSVPDDDYEPTTADITWLHGENAVPDAGWKFLDLSSPALEIPPEPPEIHGLLYPRKRHVISGPPESAKTLIGYLLLLEAQRAGHVCAIVDYEMGAYAARRLLTDLGATVDELRQLQYIPEPDGPPTPDAIAKLLGEYTSYVLIDAAVGAYDASGLDDNHRKDVERWARQWVHPLWNGGNGVSTIVVDHVTKNAETRGKFTIGSERKLGGADIHLGLEAIRNLTRGTTGLVKVTVHKDRPGFLERPTACYFELQSDPDTHQIAWQIKPVDLSEDGAFRPTVLMERVSAWLQNQDEPVSFTKVKESVQGEDKFIAVALERLIEEGYAVETAGPRKARLVSHERLFTGQNPPLRTPAEPLRAGLPSTPARASIGAGVAGDETPTPADAGVNVYDPALQALLDDDNPDF